jgi:hypothetical protein
MGNHFNSSNIIQKILYIGGLFIEYIIMLFKVNRLYVKKELKGRCIRFRTIIFI